MLKPRAIRHYYFIRIVYAGFDSANSKLILICRFSERQLYNAPI